MRWLLVLVATLPACSGRSLSAPSNGSPPGVSTDDVDLGVAHVIEVHDGYMSPAEVEIQLGETVRFVFIDPGHNATTVTSAGDMDPVWLPDDRACSLPGCQISAATTEASPQGSHWDFTPPTRDNWPIVCGRHTMGIPFSNSSREYAWVSVR
jgi:plastocyanin